MISDDGPHGITSPLQLVLRNRTDIASNNDPTRNNIGLAESRSAILLNVLGYVRTTLNRADIKRQILFAAYPGIEFIQNPGGLENSTVANVVVKYSR